MGSLFINYKLGMMKALILGLLAVLMVAELRVVDIMPAVSITELARDEYSVGIAMPNIRKRWKRKKNEL
jgi:hypothetical protein